MEGGRREGRFGLFLGLGRFGSCRWLVWPFWALLIMPFLRLHLLLPPLLVTMCFTIPFEWTTSVLTVSKVPTQCTKRARATTNKGKGNRHEKQSDKAAHHHHHHRRKQPQPQSKRNRGLHFGSSGKSRNLDKIKVSMCLCYRLITYLELW